MMHISMMRICPCTCTDFNVYHVNDEREVFIECVRCHSIRKITSPDVKVEKYDFSLPLLNITQAAKLKEDME